MDWKNLVEIFLVLLHRCPKLKWKKWRCEWEKEEKISVRNPKLCLLEKYSILLHFSYLKKNVSQILYEKSEKYRSILWQFFSDTISSKKWKKAVVPPFETICFEIKQHRKKCVKWERGGIGPRHQGRFAKQVFWKAR